MRISFYIILISIISCCGSLNQNNQPAYWIEIDNKIKTSEELPERYLAYSLNIEKLNQSIETNSKIDIPSPDGSFLIVDIEKSGTMSPELAAKYPEIKSYTVKAQPGVISGRIDINPSGFYAMVVTDSITFFINPIVKKGQQYICYNKSDAKSNVNNPFYDQFKNK